MIANARMYSVTPVVAALWRELLSAVSGEAGVPLTLLDHGEPAPIDELWRRPDKGAVFMCGLPFSRTEPPPALVAAPVPSPAEFNGDAQYWSDLVVRESSDFRAVEDTFGQRIALTVPGSQSGCVAALTYFMTVRDGFPTFRDVALFGEVIAPTITPLGALTAVIQGAADIAPIDSYALRLLRRYRPDLTSQVRIVGQTDPTPIPPLVASTPVASAGNLDALQTAFLGAHQSDSVRPWMDKLLLQRFAKPDGSSYRLLRERFEAATRYWAEHPFAKVIHPVFAM
jgi:ABC-type phosphate/phosphonate transport system substrate-binding protein